MKNLTILFFLLSSLWAPAQTVTVSEAMPLRNDAAYHLIGDLKGNILLLRDRVTEFEVQSFDENMRKVWEKEIFLDRKKPSIIGVLPTRDDFGIVYTFRNRGDLVLKTHRYDPAANLIDSATVKNYGELFYTPRIEVIRSEDKTKLLTFYYERQNEFNVLVFDLNTMKKMWEKKFVPEDVQYNRDFQQMLVDNAGNMYLILERNNRRFTDKPHQFKIISYGPSTDLLTRQFDISMGDYLTYDVLFSYDNLNKKLVAGGLFSLETRGRAEGIFYLNTDPRYPADKTLTFHRFEEEMVNTLLDKTKKKGNTIPEVSIREIVLRRDGGILLFNELNKKFERRTGTSISVYDRGGINSVDYYYDDVFVMAIHPDGAIHWKKVMHKKQFSQDDDAAFSSYFLVKTPMALRLIFNDEIQYDNTVSEYVLKANGSLDRNAVLSTADKQLRLRFRDAVQIGPNAIVVPSERRSRLKLVKIVFDKNI